MKSSYQYATSLRKPLPMFIKPTLDIFLQLCPSIPKSMNLKNWDSDSLLFSTNVCSIRDVSSPSALPQNTIPNVNVVKNKTSWLSENTKGCRISSSPSICVRRTWHVSPVVLIWLKYYCLIAYLLTRVLILLDWHRNFQSKQCKP